MDPGQRERRLYLEELPGRWRQAVPRESHHLLLFVKLYDPVQEVLAYLGSFHAQRQEKLPDIVPTLNRMAAFCEGTELQVLTSPYEQFS